MAKFKIGDRVQLVTELMDDPDKPLRPGAIGTVCSAATFPASGCAFWGVDEAQLSLLKPAKPRAIHTAADIALGEVRRELERAVSKFGPFRSSHEGYAVIKEELDELWDEVKANNAERARAEAIQVAAMAIRFMIDVSAANVKNLAEAA